jgi:hypothetical protein
MRTGTDAKELLDSTACEAARPASHTSATSVPSLTVAVQLFWLLSKSLNDSKDADSEHSVTDDRADHNPIVVVVVVDLFYCFSWRRC